MRSLIVFAKEPRPGHVKTRLAASLGSGEACGVYRAFLTDLARNLERLERTRLEWWVDGDPDAVRQLTGLEAGYHRQPGGPLGVRLRVAVAAAFATGARPVAVIGTDCPLLGPHHVEALFGTLFQGWDAAVLPAEDGGYAGLALQELVPDVFQDIPWSTDRVLKETLGALRAAGRTVRMLPSLYDVDTVRDLHRLREDLRDDGSRAPSTARVLGKFVERSESPDPVA